MKQVLVRDLDEQTLKKLKQRAANNHRSLQRELHSILQQAVISASGSTPRRTRKSAQSGRGKNAPTGSVWNWLKRSPGGNLSKEEIDDYIRTERESWGAQ